MSTDNSSHPSVRPLPELAPPEQFHPQPQLLSSLASFLFEWPPTDGSLLLLVPVTGTLGYARQLRMLHPTDIHPLWQNFDTELSQLGIGPGHLIAHTGPESVLPLQELRAQNPPRLGRILRVQAGTWWEIAAHEPERSDGHLTASDPATILAAIHAVTSQEHLAPLTDLLRPGPKALRERTGLFLDLISVLDDNDGATTPAEQLKPIHAAMRARANGVPKLTPEAAAEILLRLADVSVWARCMTLTDDTAWQLWLDLIRYADQRSFASVAGLIASTAYQREHIPMAQAAAGRALDSESLTANQRHMLKIIDHMTLTPAQLRRVISRAITSNAPPNDKPEGSEDTDGQSFPT